MKTYLSGKLLFGKLQIRVHRPKNINAPDIKTLSKLFSSAQHKIIKKTSIAL